MPRLFTALEIPRDAALSLSLLRGGLPGRTVQGKRMRTRRRRRCRRSEKGGMGGRRKVCWVSERLCCCC